MNITNEFSKHSKSWNEQRPCLCDSRKCNAFTWTYFTIINSRGIIFSLDAGISFTITLVMTLLFATVLAQNAFSTETEIKNFELEEKAMLIVDSLVKNYDENNTLLGACILDIDKKRIKTNETSILNLNNAKPIPFGEIYVESITLKTNYLQKTFQIETRMSTQCINVKRFALIDGEKRVIEVKTCTPQ